MKNHLPLNQRQSEQVSAVDRVDFEAVSCLAVSWSVVEFASGMESGTDTEVECSSVSRSSGSAGYEIDLADSASIAYPESGKEGYHPLFG